MFILSVILSESVQHNHWQYNDWSAYSWCHPRVSKKGFWIFIPITIIDFVFSTLNTALPNGGHLQSCFALRISCQAYWCWTVSQPTSDWTEEAGPFITGCCSSLSKWYVGNWQMWVSFIGQNDNHGLFHCEPDVGGLQKHLQRCWGSGVGLYHTVGLYILTKESFNVMFQDILTYYSRKSSLPHCHDLLVPFKRTQWILLVTLFLLQTANRFSGRGS